MAADIPIGPNRGHRTNRRGRGKLLAYAAFAYLLLIVYGSLVPLDFRPLPLAEAWQAFLRTPYLDLRVGSRADWIANFVLYVPLGFLGVAASPGGGGALGKILRGSAAFVVCAAVAIGVEFAQLFFAPRTVSLNDIAAELLGAFAGVFLWVAAGSRLARLSARIAAGGRPGIRAAIVAYLLAYLALSLFPYDFLISARELSWKLASGGGYLLVSPACGGTVACAAKTVAEIAAVFPLGVLMGMGLAGTPRQVMGRAALAGILLGLLIEAAQLFLASGITQGASVATRGLGAALGAAVWRRWGGVGMAAFRPHFRAALGLAAFPYLAVLAAVNGWLDGGWLGPAKALARVEEVHFLPFYYHYYTTEASGLRSLLAYTAAYLPVGLGYWLWTTAPGSRVRPHALFPALLAAVAALVMESGKLFLPSRHPDPTDVLIAGAAAGGAFWLAGRLGRGTSWIQAPPVSGSSPDPVGAEWGRRWPALALATLVAVAVFHYPVGRAALAAALAGYAWVLWRWPSAWLFAVPALLPVLDLAPWTGRFFFDEFDLVLLATVAVGWARSPTGGGGRRGVTVAGVLLGLLGLSWGASLLVGVLPLSPLDANAFTGYTSHWNSLRVAKGLGWALLLLPLLRREMEENPRAAGLFSAGMAAGLAGTAALILWERAVFPGLWNFTDDYRVTAAFSGMHTGGAYIEGYLVAALPFVALGALTARGYATRLAALALFGLGAYGVAVTFSRGGYGGFALAAAVMAAGVAVRWFRRREGRAARAVPALGAVVALAAVPALNGPFMQSRLARSGEDMAVRAAHWKDALRMMDAGCPTALFGMGLGRYPEAYLWKNAEGARPAGYRFERGDGNAWLRLGSGDSLYLDQIVPLSPGRTYVLSADIRANSPKAALTASICEKSLLYSLRCQWLRLDAGDGAWRRREAVFHSGERGGGPGYARRPVKLSLSNAGAGTVVEVDDVRLIGPDGRNLVVNGDFSRGGDRWFFSTDNHLPWHVKNLWVQVFFEQGALGLAAFVLVTGLALVRAGARAWRGDLPGTALAAALAGFLAVGFFDSLFDAPRLALLFYLLMFLALRSPGPMRQNSHRAAAAPTQSRAASVAEP